MPNYYTPLPGAEIKNALVDFSPINNGLETLRDQHNTNRNALMQQQQIDMRKEEQTYQRGRDAKQDARQQVEWFGKVAGAVDREQDPARRAAIWQNALKRHPDAASLSPDYLDPIKGPKMVMAEAGQWRDPRDDQAKDLELQKTRAEIGKLNRDATEAGAAYGKTGSIVQGPDGKFYSVRYNANGTERINPIEVGGQGLAPSKGVDVVGDTMFDKATGQTVRNVGANIASGEQSKVVGKETGERVMGSPKAQAALASANAKSELVIGKIREALPMINQWSAGYGSMLSGLPATQARDLKEKINTIIANMGFEELQDMRTNSPTGGALGAIAVQELEMLQKTRASLDQAQSVPQLVAAFKDLEKFYAGANARRQQAFEATYGPALRGQQPQSAPHGSAPQQSTRPRAVNPQTGQTVEFDGQQWIEVR